MYSFFSIIGAQIGVATAMLLGGWLCNTNFLGGWPSVFYVFGTVGIIWGILWFLLVPHRPQNDPILPESELKHINSKQNFIKKNKVKRKRFVFKMKFILCHQECPVDLIYTW